MLALRDEAKGTGWIGARKSGTACGSLRLKAEKIAIFQVKLAVASATRGKELAGK